MPAPGTWLRPLGTFRWGYTLRVVAVDRDGIEYERWGTSHGRPVDDGHISKGCYTLLQPTLLPGVWRYPPANVDDGHDSDEYRWAAPSHQLTEVYFLACPGPVGTQMELLA